MWIILWPYMIIPYWPAIFEEQVKSNFARKLKKPKEKTSEGEFGHDKDHQRTWWGNLGDWRCFFWLFWFWFTFTKRRSNTLSRSHIPWICFVHLRVVFFGCVEAGCWVPMSCRKRCGWIMICPRNPSSCKWQDLGHHGYEHQSHHSRKFTGLQGIPIMKHGTWDAPEFVQFAELKIYLENMEHGEVNCHARVDMETCSDAQCFFRKPFKTDTITVKWNSHRKDLLAARYGGSPIGFCVCFGANLGFPNTTIAPKCYVKHGAVGERNGEDWDACKGPLSQTAVLQPGSDDFTYSFYIT